jgi:hypothetical protein
MVLACNLDSGKRGADHVAQIEFGNRPSPILIDELLPVHDFSRRYQICVAAPIDKVYGVVRRLDLTEAHLLRALFWLRSIPARLQGHKGLGPTLDDLQKLGLVVLGEAAPREVTFGFIGKLWTASGGLVKVDPNDFRAFATPGFAKAVWNFTLAPTPDGHTCLATETRVACLDDASRRKFRRYAFFIGPLSGATRWDALRACKRQSEGAELRSSV